MAVAIEENEIMDKKLASEIINSAMELGAVCNKIEPLLRRITEDDERKEFLRCLGKIMGDVNINMILPIIKKYPELDPDK